MPATILKSHYTSFSSVTTLNLTTGLDLVDNHALIIVVLPDAAGVSNITQTGAGFSTVKKDTVGLEYHVAIARRLQGALDDITVNFLGVTSGVLGVIEVGGLRQTLVPRITLDDSSGTGFSTPTAAGEEGEFILGIAGVTDGNPSTAFTLQQSGPGDVFAAIDGGINAGNRSLRLLHKTAPPGVAAQQFDGDWGIGTAVGIRAHFHVRSDPTAVLGVDSINSTAEVVQARTIRLDSSTHPAVLNIDLGYTPTPGNFLWVGFAQGDAAPPVLNSIVLGDAVWTSNVVSEYGGGEGVLTTAYAPNVQIPSNVLTLNFDNPFVGGVVTFLEVAGITAVPSGDVANIDYAVDANGGTVLASGVAVSDNVNKFIIAHAATRPEADGFTLNTGAAPYQLVGSALGVGEEVWTYIGAAPFSGTDVSIDGTTFLTEAKAASVELFNTIPIGAIAGFESPVAKINDHVEIAQSKLISQFRGKTRLEQLLSVYTKQTQDLEDAFNSILTKTPLSVATGVTLDAIGSIVDEPRSGRTDTAYRQAILAKGRAISADGTASNIIEVFQILGQGGLLITLQDVGPATFKLDLTENLTELVSVEQFVTVLQQIHSAGVQVLFSPPNAFKFDTTGFGFDEGVFGGTF